MTTWACALLHRLLGAGSSSAQGKLLATAQARHITSIKILDDKERARACQSSCKTGHSSEKLKQAVALPRAGIPLAPDRTRIPIFTGDSFSWYRDVFFCVSRFFDLLFGIEIFFDLHFTGCRGPKKHGQFDPKKRRYRC